MSFISFIKRILLNKKNKLNADIISAWITTELENSVGVLKISNISNFSFSRVIFTTVNVQRKASKGKDAPDEFRTFLSTVPPGISYSRILIHHGMSFISGIEIAFEDLNGNYWIKNGDGQLFKIDSPPYQYYKIPLPISWELPIQEDKL